MKTQFSIYLEIDDITEHYLHSCAKIRDISTNRLLQRMIQIICDEQMILSILDDDSKQPRRLPGETSDSRYNDGWRKKKEKKNEKSNA